MSEVDKMTAYIEGNLRYGVYPPGSEVIVVDEASVPSDHECDNSCEFFDAWVLKEGKPIVDMDRARLIKLEQIRKARKPELAKLDISYLRALEAGNSRLQLEIAAKKQTLRDLPQTFDLSKAQTVTQLKSIWPNILSG